MNSHQIRQKFINFFQKRNHEFVKSSPISLKDDPSLLFVNAGMNQFKDFFLGTRLAPHDKIVNSQKCLRVSGKHNDLEEVGHDTYHHTMFEMLGSWSFGDYFKQNAIELAWKFLTDELKISEDRLYVTYFEGSPEENIEEDIDTFKIWSKTISKNKIIAGKKKDNFWEMGKIGPCGPCTEIHIDLREENDISSTDARKLINRDHPLVIEIWNIVFIEFNRSSDGKLTPLPKKHVDTGMGFERLCMVMQNKKSTYDTDLFENLLNKLEKQTGYKYGADKKKDIACRVIVDHIRAIVFSVADDQLPSNTGAGYVVRRILRRAVRYGYTFLDLQKPFLFNFVDTLGSTFHEVFSEINDKKDVISSVILNEEKMFFKTLEKGLLMINDMIEKNHDLKKRISGKEVFTLYDTYGFPPDLTSLILKEKKQQFDMLEFENEMIKQKKRSKANLDSSINVGDWFVVNNFKIEGFDGYENTNFSSRISKYRFVKGSDGISTQIVFNRTPFYARGGGQVGDTGYFKKKCSSENKILKKYFVSDTFKENSLIIHLVKSEISDLDTSEYMLEPNLRDRDLISKNHSATHILHHVLRLKLGKHVEQRGSYVDKHRLRFDFSHFEKINENCLKEIENEVNTFIQSSFQLIETRNLSLKAAKDMGAISLFGEKYQDKVRVIEFGKSKELCGGTHVQNTIEISVFKIISESSVSSGVRRIEALTGLTAFEFLNNEYNRFCDLKKLTKTSDNINDFVADLIKKNKELKKYHDRQNEITYSNILEKITSQMIEFSKFKLILSNVNVNPSDMKNICFDILKKIDNVIIVLITNWNNKHIINIAVSKSICDKGIINSKFILDEFGDLIQAKGGGQLFYVVGSVNKISGSDSFFKAIKNKIKNL